MKSFSDNNIQAFCSACGGVCWFLISTMVVLSCIVHGLRGVVVDSFCFALVSNEMTITSEEWPQCSKWDFDMCSKLALARLCMFCCFPTRSFIHRYMVMGLVIPQKFRWQPCNICISIYAHIRNWACKFCWKLYHEGSFVRDTLVRVATVTF